MHPECVEITRAVFWQDPVASFHASPCHCVAGEDAGCCEQAITPLRDRRQTFLRGLRDSGVSLDRLLETYPNSAVAFGSNTKTPQPRPPIATRTSSAIYHFLPFRNTSIHSANAPASVPNDPLTPEHSPSRFTQQRLDNEQIGGNKWEILTHSSVIDEPICTSRKAAQIWLLFLLGKRDKAESLIRHILNSGVDAEHVDKICYDSGHSSDNAEAFHESLLGFACRSGDFEFVQFLQQRGFPANKTNSLGISPLEEAASMNHVRVIHELLSSYQGATEINKALMIAVRAGHESTAELLLEHAQQLDDALGEACHSEQIRMVHLLIGKGADPNADYARVFRDALANGSVRLVEALLEHDIDSSLLIAMTEAMEDQTTQPDKLPEDFGAKLSLLKRSCSEICTPDGLDFLIFQSDSSSESL